MMTATETEQLRREIAASRRKRNAEERRESEVKELEARLCEAVFEAETMGAREWMVKGGPRLCRVQAHVSADFRAVLVRSTGCSIERPVRHAGRIGLSALRNAVAELEAGNIGERPEW